MDETLLQHTGELSGLLHTGTLQQLHVDGQTTIIRRCHEVRTDKASKHRNQGNAEECHNTQHRQLLVGQTPTQQVRIGGIQLIQESHHRIFVRKFLRILLLDNQITIFIHLNGLRLQQLGAKHRHKGDSHQSGGTADDRHDPTQLLEQDTGDTRQHRQRHEHRTDHQRRGDHGYPHLVRRIDGRLTRVRASVDMRGDVLQDHNGIVHHHTHGNGKGTEGDDVQRTVNTQQVKECDQQGDWDGQSDNHTGTPLTQEEEHHEDHEEDRIQHSLFQGIDGTDNIRGGVVDLIDLHIRRKGCFDLLQLLVDITTDLHSVSTRLLRNDQTDSLLADITAPRGHLLVQAQVLDGITHRRDVTHIDLLAIRHGSHHDVLYLGALEVLATHLQSILLLLHLHVTGREVQVVGGNRITDRLQRDAISIQLFLVDFNVDITVRLTGHRHVTHTVDTVQLRDNDVVHDLLQARITLARLHGELDNRHGRTIKLDNQRVGTSAWQIILRHVHIRTDIIDDVIQLFAPFKLQSDQGKVILRGGGQFVQTIHRVQTVLQVFRHVGLHLTGVGARVGGHDGDIRRLNLRELVDRQLQIGEDTHQHNGHENQDRGDRFVNRCFIYAHIYFDLLYFNLLSSTSLCRSSRNRDNLTAVNYRSFASAI